VRNYAKKAKPDCWSHASSDRLTLPLSFFLQSLTDEKICELHYRKTCHETSSIGFCTHLHTRCLIGLHVAIQGASTVMNIVQSSPDNSGFDFTEGWSQGDDPFSKKLIELFPDQWSLLGQ